MTPYPTCTYHVGNALTVMRTLPDASVDLVLSSPPFLGLRSYLPADHPDKDAEMGSEPTPGEFIDALLNIVEEADRVLVPHGSLVFELGDTYAGSGGAGGDYNVSGLREGQERFDGSASKAYGTGAAPRPARNRWRSPGPDPRYPQRGEQSRGTGAGGEWPLDKSLCLVPELLRFALAYGFNPLTGRQTPRWRVRNVVRWCRPNPPVGALGDKFRPGTSEMVVACKSRTRFFDLDAVRTPGDRPPHTDNRGGHKREGIPGRTGQVMNPVDENGHRIQENANGAPPLDWWKISTEPYAGSHYATWPTELLRRPILAMCPERVCTTCGEPSRRLTAATYINPHTEKAPSVLMKDRKADRVNQWNGHGDQTVSRVVETLGWSDCGHGTYRYGVVLDPFAGSGTTLQVAHGHGRSSIGIDLDARNLDLARQRLGMFLDEPTEATA